MNIEYGGTPDGREFEAEDLIIGSAVPFTPVEEEESTPPDWVSFWQEYDGSVIRDADDDHVYYIIDDTAVAGNKRVKRSKPPMSMLPGHILARAARVMELGAWKYGLDNWREEEWSITEMLDAALRHIFQFSDGEDLDSESGECHLIHAVVTLIFASEYFYAKTHEDDRPRVSSLWPKDMEVIECQE